MCKYNRINVIQQSNLVNYLQITCFSNNFYKASLDYS